MKTFWNRVGLLLWKNFLLRKRQKLRNVIEIVWPLAIFIILALVRSSRPPTFQPEDYRGNMHFAPRALPSAGALPFIQSMFCDYAVNKSYKQPQTIPNYSNTTLVKLVKDLVPILSNETLLNELQYLPGNLSDAFENIQQISNDFNATEFPLADIFGNESLTVDALRDLEIANTTLSSLAESSIKLEEFVLEVGQIDWTKFSQNPTEIVQELEKSLCTNGTMDRIIDVPASGNKTAVTEAICGNFVSIMLTLIPKATERSQEIFANFLNMSEVVDAEKRLNELQKEVTPLLNLLQESDSLLNLYNDVSGILRATQQGGSNMGVLLDPQHLLCGKKSDPKEHKKKEEKEAKEKKQKQNFPPKGGSKNAVCNAVPPANRSDCGWGGITEDQCHNMKCCFDGSIPHSKYCFCPTTNASSCCNRRRQLIELFSLSPGSTGSIADLLTNALSGKILYAPENNKTRNLVTRVNHFLLTFLEPFNYKKELKTAMKGGLALLKEITKDRRYVDLINSAVRFLQSPTGKFVLRNIPNQNITEQQIDMIVNMTSQIESLLNSTAPQNQNTTSQLEKSAKQALNYYVAISEALHCFDLQNFFKGFENEEKMVDYALKIKSSVFLSSVVFLNVNDENPFPKHLKYKIRSNPDYTPSTAKITYKFWKPGPGPRGYSSLGQYGYINFGFVFLQDMIERTAISLISNSTVWAPGLYAQQFPYPCYIRDQYIAALGNSMPLFMTVAWVYTVAMIVRSIVHEKERRLKEIMKVMGLTDAVHWTAWFITSLVFMFTTILILSLVLKYADILIYSDLSLVIVVMTVFAVASIVLAFFITVFFSRANISAACGGMIYFFTYLPYPLTLWFEEQMTFSLKALVSLLSTTSFGLAFKYICRWEEQGIGAQWSNLFKNPVTGDDFSIGWSLVFMIIDVVIYAMLLWYFSAVMPGEYGMPKVWYFPVKKMINFFKKLKQRDHDTLNDSYSLFNGNMANPGGIDIGMIDSSEMLRDQRSSEHFEKEPTNKSIGVTIQALTKIYSRRKKPAVSSLNLNLYEDQVTTLLGHNGAGKSTMMSILTGLFPPTHGTAVVYGDDIRTDMDRIRLSLGLCPQYNVLFDGLTVEEHMRFYGKLKGLRGAELDQQVEKLLVDVGLPDKRDDLSKNLSGGMKRKLSVAMAFIADSKTVILDEPTSGVDPYSRRGIWDLIIKYKQNRTILLSTHYMDEADIIGDRIAIISEGQLQCCGTPLFLKRCYGKGYIFTVTHDNPTASQITNFVKSFVPGTTVAGSRGDEITFVLPSAARLTGEFENLFQHLEECTEKLNVKSYGLSDTTLEEVFLKACDSISSEEATAIEREMIDVDRQSIVSSDSLAQLVPSDDIPFEGQPQMEFTKPNRSTLYAQQFIALLNKRFIHTRRNFKGFFSQIILPAIFIVASMCVSLLQPDAIMQPKLELSTSMFPQDYVVVSRMQSNRSQKLMRAYVGEEWDDSTLKMTWNQQSSWSQARTCGCNKGKQQCSGSLPAHPQYKTADDTFVDVSGKDVNDYVLSTSDYFVKKRYGGATFGLLENSLNMGEDTNTTQALAGVFGVKEHAKVWYNLKGYHALPAFVNKIDNAILKANLPPNVDHSQYGVTAYNHPMEFNKSQLEDETLRRGIPSLFVAVFVIIALAFVPASFLVYLVEDRTSNCKHLQFVSGLNPVVYWCSNYTWDMINYMLSAVCCIIIFAIFNQEAYVSASNFPATVVLLFLYGWAMTAMMYPVSFVMGVPSTAYVVMITTNLFIGVVTTMSTFILEFIGDGDAELQEINKLLKRVFLIFPSYCMGRGLMDLAGNQLRSEIFERFGVHEFRDPFEWDIVGRNVFAMFVCGVVCFIITILVELKPNKFFCKNRFKNSPLSNGVSSDDENVRNEEKRIKQEEEEGKDFVLKTSNLCKTYVSGIRGRKGKLAVNNVTFGVQRGECFGLLGINGAGKTSTFKMLTGETEITSGDAFVKGYSIEQEMVRTRELLGYCPQFDAVDGLLTGTELLLYFAQLRGMDRRSARKMTDWAIETLGLTPYKDAQCGDYSGGNKRKLSTAIALIGRPPLIFLDEPTTGMDPGARRFLWDVLTHLLQSGTSMVLTSHSMEECESLCSRIAIMVNGQFQCLGSPQHLRTTYGTGYTVIIRCKNTETVEQFIEANFPQAQLKERHHNMLEYRLANESLKLSQIFHKLEMLRKTKATDEYSIFQTTLDQIFVNFARNQLESMDVNDVTEPYESLGTNMTIMDDVNVRNVVV